MRSPAPLPETLLLVSATILTLIIAAPVLGDLDGRLFGAELAGYHPDPYIVIDQFEGAPRLTMFTQPATDWLGIALARAVGGVAAYNLIVLVTFPLAALFAFLLARRLQVPPWPAALAAFAYAFAPFHLAHAAGHPHIVQIQWFPAYLLALVACLERWTPRRAAWLIAAGGLLALSNFYAGLIALVLTPVALPVLWLVNPRTDGVRGTRTLAGTAGTLAGAGVIGAIYVWRVAGDRIFGDSGFAFPREDLFRYCARWWSYLVPGIEHPLLGEWSRGVWNRHGIAGGVGEQQVFLGWAALVLAVVGVASWLRERERPRPGPVAWVPALALIAIVAFLFSLPPEGRLAGLPRPSAILHFYLPFFRAHARFAMAVQLTVFLLAAIGLTRLLRSDRRGARTTGLLLAALVVFELTPLPAQRWRWVLPTAAHRWVDSRTEPLRVLDCARERPGEEYRLARMGHPVLLARGTVSDCAEPGLGGKLAALGFSHMIVRNGYAPTPPAPQPGFRLLESFSDSRLLAVTASPAPIFTGAIRGFSWREVEDSGTFRWMGTEGAWEVVNDTGVPTLATLELEMIAFPRPRDLTLTLNGAAIANVTVGTERKHFRLGRLALDPGRNALTFRATGKPVVADRVLANGDQRALSLAVWSWAWRIDP